MSEPQLPTICDLKFDFNEPTERKAAFAWLRIVALVLTNVERQQLRQYLKALRRDERGECVIVRSRNGRKGRIPVAQAHLGERGNTSSAY